MSVTEAHNTEINSPAGDIPICINCRVPICIFDSGSKPQQMPDCGFVSLTRRLAVTVGYNSREIPLPVKGSLLTVRDPFPSPFLSSSLLESTPLVRRPPFRHSTCHASRNANFIVERILDIAAPFISRRRLQRRNELNVESTLYAETTTARNGEPRTVIALLKFPSERPRDGRGSRRSSIIIDNRIA